MAIKFCQGHTIERGGQLAPLRCNSQLGGLRCANPPYRAECIDKIIDGNTALFKQTRESTSLNLMMIRYNATLRAFAENNMTASLAYNNKA